MTFHLVRIGWPNTVAVLALAVMPIVSLTDPAQPARRERPYAGWSKPRRNPRWSAAVDYSVE